MPEELGGFIVFQNLLTEGPVIHGVGEIVNFMQHLQNLLGGKVLGL